MVSITKIEVLKSFPTLVSSQMDAKVSLSNTMRRWVRGLSTQTLPLGQSPHPSAVNRSQEHLSAPLQPMADLKEDLAISDSHIHKETHRPTVGAFWGSLALSVHALREGSAREGDQRRECT